MGTIEVTDDERAALAEWFGEPGLATRKLVREWAISVVNGAWQDIGPPHMDE